MRGTTWTARLVVTGTLVAGIGLSGASAAVAQGDDSTAPAPITISSEQVQWLCQHRVPTIESRIGKLTDRINGGPGVVGSTQWLDAQAQRAKNAGHPEIADRLQARSQRRAGVVTRLDAVKQKLDTFTANHCGGGS